MSVDESPPSAKMPTATTSPSAASFGPALPPHLPSTTHRTVDEVAAELKRSPFFMTSADDIGDETNPEVEAIRALMHEGSRAEVADRFRDQGNELAQTKRWKDAKECYNKALAALEVDRKEEDATGPEEERVEAGLKEACFANRALCHLELSMNPAVVVDIWPFPLPPSHDDLPITQKHKPNTHSPTPPENYRSCTNDCTSTLALNPTNLKAHYRLARAHHALHHHSLAISTCRAGLLLAPTSAPLLSLLAVATTAATAAATASNLHRTREQAQRAETLRVTTALQARGIITRTTPHPAPFPQNATIRLVPSTADNDNDNPSSPTTTASPTPNQPPQPQPTFTLTFPLTILYPLSHQSDFIAAFPESSSLLPHLAYLLPPPWDTSGEYADAAAVDAYVETAKGGLAKWGLKVRLGTVLGVGGGVVVDGGVEVFVVPRGEGEGKGGKWVEGVRRRMGKG